MTKFIFKTKKTTENFIKEDTPHKIFKRQYYKPSIDGFWFFIGNKKKTEQKKTYE